jgi:vancomycin permeability regulator SanA
MLNRLRQRILPIFLTCAFLAFTAVCLSIVIDGMRDEIGHADVAVVLGSKVMDDGRPSPRLQARLDKAAELYREDLFPEILVSGATGLEGYDESRVMREYLIKRGVPAEHIHMDPQGFNTYETARNTARWMKARGVKRVIAISQHFHLPRTRLALRRFGIKEVYTAHADLYELRDIYSTAREVVAWGSYMFKAYPHDPS